MRRKFALGDESIGIGVAIVSEKKNVVAQTHTEQYPRNTQQGSTLNTQHSTLNTHVLFLLVPFPLPLPPLPPPLFKVRGRRKMVHSFQMFNLVRNVV